MFGIDDANFPAARHTVPFGIGVAVHTLVDFSECIIAPGLEIRKSTESDKRTATQCKRNLGCFTAFSADNSCGGYAICDIY